jgi:glycerol-3-phosphate dehydrogenase
MPRTSSPVLGPRRKAPGLGAPSFETVERTLALASSIGLKPASACRVLSVAGDRAGTAPACLRATRSRERLIPGLPPLAVEAVWAVRAQMALTLSDVLDRRLGLAQFDADAGIGSRAADLLAGEWGGGRVEREIQTYLATGRRERGWRPWGAALSAQGPSLPGGLGTGSASSTRGRTRLPAA